MKPCQHIQLNRLLYALFLVLYLLFQMSVQVLAACNLDLHTAGRHTTNLWGASCPLIKKKALLALTWALAMPFSCVLYALYHFIHIISKLETAFGCVFIAENLVISTSTTGDQWGYKQEHQGLNHKSPTSPLLCCQLPQPAHPDRSCGCTPAMQHAIQAWT
jgi:hypothetical protein